MGGNSAAPRREVRKTCLIRHRTDNQIKNFFYCKLRKGVKKLNMDFKSDDKYKSKRD